MLSRCLTTRGVAKIDEEGEVAPNTIANEGKGSWCILICPLNPSQWILTLLKGDLREILLERVSLGIFSNCTIPKPTPASLIYMLPPQSSNPNHTVIFCGRSDWA